MSEFLERYIVQQAAESQLDRIERKLDALLKALAEDDDQPATESLDGQQVPKPGQESRSL